jgi:hypothetical protein
MSRARCFVAKHALLIFFGALLAWALFGSLLALQAG